MDIFLLFCPSVIRGPWLNVLRIGLFLIWLVLDTIAIHNVYLPLLCLFFFSSFKLTHTGSWQVEVFTCHLKRRGRAFVSDTKRSFQLKSLNHKTDAFGIFYTTFHTTHFLQKRVIFSWFRFLIARLARSDPRNHFSVKNFLVPFTQF